MIITGEATIHGKVGSVVGIREKAMGGLVAFPNVTVNMVIPRDNAVLTPRGNSWDSSIWSTYSCVDRGCEDAHSAIQRDWFTLGKDDRARLNVFAAETLYDVLELAIVLPPGMVFSMA